MKRLLKGGQNGSKACGGRQVAFSKECKPSKEDDNRIKEKLLATPWRHPVVRKVPQQPDADGFTTVLTEGPQ